MVILRANHYNCDRKKITLPPYHMTTPNITHRAARYLQAIHTLNQKNNAVRQIDVSRYLDVKPSSCFSAILGLMRKGYVIENDKKFLSLSKEAIDYVKRLKKNDSILANFFVQVLGMSRSQATEDAQRIEYVASEELALHLCKFLHFWHEHPESIQFPEQLKNFKRYPDDHESCNECPFHSACRAFNQEAKSM